MAGLAGAFSSFLASLIPNELPQSTRSSLLTSSRALTNSLLDPGSVVQQHSLQMAELICIRNCLELKIFEAMGTSPSEGISIKALSERTGVEDKLLERLLRPLLATSFLTTSTQDDEVLYHPSALSISYTSAPGLFFTLMFDNFLVPMTSLPSYLEKYGKSEPTDFYVNPYSAHFGLADAHMTTWEIMSRDPSKLDVFQRGLGMASAMVPIAGYYDYNALALTPEEEANGVLSLIDVGGGNGNTLAKILAAYKELKPENIMLQDQKEVIELATGKDRVLPEGAKTLVHDFWTEEPVKGAKAYLIRRVLHDYSDALCAKILSSIIPAMSADSRILVSDMLLPDIMTPAHGASAALDVACMVMGGKERTEKDFRELFASVGLDLTVHKAEGGGYAIMEGKLKAGTAAEDVKPEEANVANETDGTIVEKLEQLEVEQKTEE